MSLFKAAQRRLAFMNKEGFDRFGRNKLFAPLLKWQTFKEEIVAIQTYADQYEKVYNGLKAAIDRKDATDKILKAIPQPAIEQVNAQKARLVEDKRIALTEKNLYVQVYYTTYILKSQSARCSSTTLGT